MTAGLARTSAGRPSAILVLDEQDGEAPSPEARESPSQLALLHVAQAGGDQQNEDGGLRQGLEGDAVEVRPHRRHDGDGEQRLGRDAEPQGRQPPRQRHDDGRTRWHPPPAAAQHPRVGPCGPERSSRQATCGPE